MNGARALEAITVAKPWGVDQLPAPFANARGERIGEIWFDPPPELPDLLVKYLFTSEKLSVQVHPSDTSAPPGCRGKDECWLVLDAEPGACLAVGFRDPIAGEAIRAAALDGSIEDLLQWHHVRRGDFFYLPAGTVHAIGGGVTILEVQQNSDITYRLFDYGRPRELHLDDAIAVASGTPFPADKRDHFDLATSAVLVDGPFFLIELQAGPLTSDTLARFAGGHTLVLPLDGEVVTTAGRFGPGACVVTAELAQTDLAPGARAILAQSR